MITTLQETNKRLNSHTYDSYEFEIAIFYFKIKHGSFVSLTEKCMTLSNQIPLEMEIRFEFMHVRGLRKKTMMNICENQSN